MKRLLSHIGLVVATLSIVLTTYVLFRPAFFAPHDFTHAARIAELARGLRAGEFPVRWSENFGFGYGMPLFTFYAPLPYYIGAVLMLSGLGAVMSIKALIVIETVIACGSMYLLARSWWGKWGAIVSSTFFVFSTYRALDIYVRGALGEAFAMSFIPLSLYGATLLYQRKKGGVMWLALGVAATLLSHNLTGLALCAFLAPALILFGVSLRLDPKKMYAFFVRACIGVFLGVSLSAFYTIPAFLEKSYTRVSETITTGYFDFHNHFLCNKQLVTGVWKYGASFQGCSDDLSFAVGVIPLIVAVLASVWLLKRGKGSDRVKLGIGVLWCGVAAFLTLGRSVWIWEHISLLSYFQFPWRFLVFVHVGLALLCGAIGMVALKQKAVVMTLLCGLMMLTSWSIFRPQSFISGPELAKYYQDSPTFIREDMSKTLNDYLPPGIRDTALPSPVTERLVSTGAIKMITDRPSAVHATVTCENECPVEVHIFQYPGWSAHVDGKQMTLTPTQKKTYMLTLAAGVHDIRIQLVPTLVQQVSLGLSMISLGVLVLILVRNFKMKQVY